MSREKSPHNVTAESTFSPNPTLATELISTSPRRPGTTPSKKVYRYSLSAIESLCCCGGGGWLRGDRGLQNLYGSLPRNNCLNRPLFVLNVAFAQDLQDVDESAGPQVCASPGRGDFDHRNETQNSPIDA